MTDEKQELETMSEEEILGIEDYSWDDLLELKNHIATSVLEFTAHFKSITDNPQVTSLLKGEDKVRYNKTVDQFYIDMQKFASEVEAVRGEHEHKSGPVLDLEEFNIHNRCAMNYQVLFEKLTILTTPIISNVMIMLSEVAGLENQLAKEAEQKALVEEAKECVETIEEKLTEVDERLKGEQVNE